MTMEADKAFVLAKYPEAVLSYNYFDGWTSDIYTSPNGKSIATGPSNSDAAVWDNARAVIEGAKK